MKIEEMKKALELLSSKNLFMFHAIIMDVMKKRGMLPDPAQNPDLSKFIRLLEFEKKYKFISENTIGKYCKRNNFFRENIAVLSNNKWLVNEEKALEFFSNLPIFKKRIARLNVS